MLIAAPGCVKEISSEERLDRETRTVPLEEAGGAAELEKINCQDADELLAQARNVNRPETERVSDYIELFKDLQNKTRTFEQVMARNPDLEYREGSQRFAAARDICVQQTADAQVEFERYVRELVDLPTVQELKGGNTLTVARLDFDTLRDAIETLSSDDKETLLSRVAAAEKRVEAVSDGAKKSRRKR
ncbi:MAG: hypothetical protein WBV82_11185 [Myxococcaceae bacterium]